MPREKIDESWATASLRIHSKKLRAQHIGEVLGAGGTMVYEIGDPISERSPSAKRVESLWLRESGLERLKPLEEHLLVLLDFMDSKRPELASIRGECEVDLFCGYASRSGQGSMLLTASTIARVAEYRVDLSVDLYPPEAPDTSIPGNTEAGL